MKKTLLIVESPTKAKKIAEYLGPNYIVKSSYGHIRDLSSSHYIGIDIDNDFKLYYQILKDKLSVVDELINDANKCDMILLASDPDREGEKIADDLKTLLESTGIPIKRVLFNEITKEAIIKAVKNPIDIDQNLLSSQQARRALDRIVGFKVSPFLINYFSNNLSAGRVQSVAVRMIADRDKEIKSFIPKEYWNLFINFTKNNQNLQAKYEGKISNKKELDKIKQELNNDYIVSEIKSKDKKEKPPAPLITSKLQQVMAAKFSFDAERTMRCAQNLYEHGYCTYIRTDSTQTSEEALLNLRKWIKENELPISKIVNSHKDGKAAQGAHECIRPTNISTKKEEIALSNDDKQVYDIIRKYFIASQMDDAIFGLTDIIIKNNKHSFKISGKILKQKGYLEIFNFNSNDEILPHFNKNEKIMVKNTAEEKKSTQPLPRYTDATLIKELEKRQIGRPATFADILKKITNRNYVEKKGNTYNITELGNTITDILCSNFKFMDYLFTAELEEKLDLIADGKITYLSVMQEFYKTFKVNLTDAYIKQGSKLCKCGSHMILRKNRNNENFLGCSRYPSCRETNSVEETITKLLDIL